MIEGAGAGNSGYSLVEVRPDGTIATWNDVLRCEFLDLLELSEPFLEQLRDRGSFPVPLSFDGNVHGRGVCLF